VNTTVLRQELAPANVVPVRTQVHYYPCPLPIPLSVVQLQGGKIEIDGYNIRNVGLDILRG
jgi:hypothetical protein